MERHQNIYVIIYNIAFSLFKNLNLDQENIYPKISVHVVAVLELFGFDFMQS